MSKYNVTLVFEDGRSERILVDENDTIYMACLRNKIRILTDCLEGACATCKGFCVQGEYNLDDVSEEALSEEEACPTRSDRHATDEMTRDLHAHTTASTCFGCGWL